MFTSGAVVRACSPFYGTLLDMFKDPFYHVVVQAFKRAYQAMDIRFSITGMEHIEQLKPGVGALLVTNHTGYLDFTFAGVPFERLRPRRLVRFMAKAEVFDNKFAGPFMRAMKHIPVDRIDGQVSFDQAIYNLQQGELVGIFPEGTVSRSLEVKGLRSGAVRIAHSAGVPIIPVLLCGSQRIWPKGGKKQLGRKHIPLEILILPPWQPSGNVGEDTQKLHAMMDKGVHQLWDIYLAKYGPFAPGEPWVPARLGGGAPTLEECTKEDDALVKERRRVRDLRNDMEKLTSKVQELNASFSKWKEDHTGENAQTDTKELVRSMWLALEQLAEDASRGVKEGATKLNSATSDLRGAMGQLQQQMVQRYNDPHYQEALIGLLSEAKQLRDRLPLRQRALLPKLPARVITDVDGTIWNGSEVSEAVRLAIHRAMDAGATYVMATGRPPAGIQKICRSLDYWPVAVAANGAVVYDTKTEEILHTFGISEEAQQAVAAAVEEHLPADARIVKDEVAGTVVKISVFADGPSDELCALLREPLAGIVDVTFSIPQGHVEIAPHGVTKATGLKWLFEQNGWDLKDAVAFGDMPNDLEMLDLVGVGIAMGNAEGSVIKAARWVCAPLAEDGVAQVLNNVIDHQEQK